MKHRWPPIAFALTLAACNRPSAPAPRGDALPTLHVRRVDAAALRVDGLLDEPAWRRADGTGSLVHPGNGAEVPGSRVRGEAWFLWTDERLYVAARVRDPHPDAPFSQREVDPHLWERASAVELMLQPGDPGDNRDYYELQADTVCALWSTRFDDYNRPRTTGPDGRVRYGHQEWTPSTDCAAHVGSDGYTLELALRWADFSDARRATLPPRPGDVWRANVYSFRDGQRDALAWSPLLNRGNFHFAPRFGRLVFDGP